ncbi:heavy metal translocating P-type ATPase, partial [Acinetobacter variabilis]
VSGSANVDDLITAIDKAGYDATEIQASIPDQTELLEKKDQERAELKRDLILATLLALPVFILEMGSHLIPGVHQLIDQTIGMQNSWYLQFILTTLVLVIPGRRFYLKG